MKPHQIVTTILVCACLAVAHSGCATIREAAWPAAGAASGAAVGSLGGPIGMIVGAALGASIVAVTNQNDELREGSLQGDGASAKEISLLKSTLASKEQDLESAGEAITNTVKAKGTIERTLSDAYLWLKIACGAAAVLLALHHPKGRAAVGAAFRAVTGLFAKASTPTPPTT